HRTWLSGPSVPVPWRHMSVGGWHTKNISVQPAFIDKKELCILSVEGNTVRAESKKRIVNKTTYIWLNVEIDRVGKATDCRAGTNLATAECQNPPRDNR
ncbi:hypothetical protein HAX54_052844, partial [Datura stramonium]|nr:hypothetical protein [Datura stramonium]